VPPFIAAICGTVIRFGLPSMLTFVSLLPWAADFTARPFSGKDLFAV
jgi:hypothetical protein